MPSRSELIEIGVITSDYPIPGQLPPEVFPPEAYRPRPAGAAGLAVVAARGDRRRRGRLGRRADRPRAHAHPLARAAPRRLAVAVAPACPDGAGRVARDRAGSGGARRRGGGRPRGGRRGARSAARTGRSPRRRDRGVRTDGARARRAGARPADRRGATRVPPARHARSGHAGGVAHDADGAVRGGTLQPASDPRVRAAPRRDRTQDRARSRWPRRRPTTRRLSSRTTSVTRGEPRWPINGASPPKKRTRCDQSLSRASSTARRRGATQATSETGSMSETSAPPSAASS